MVRWLGFLKKGGAQCTEIAFNANTICLLSANVSGTVGGSEFGRQVWHTQKCFVQGVSVDS